MADLNGALERLERLLAPIRENGIRNRIAGEWRSAADGRTFETRSPVDGSAIARVARGGSADIDEAARAAKAAFAAWRDVKATERRRSCTASPMALSPRRRDRHARMLGHRPGLALHVQGRPARCGELPLLCRPRAGSP
ncbi:MAG: aldehyde dehydrogenase family protein [Geminicoccaceae bacterium]